MHGLRVKKIRENKGFKQDYVAEKLGMSVPYYSQIENGKKVLSTKHTDKLAEILEVTVPQLFEGSNDSSSQTITIRGIAEAGNWQDIIPDLSADKPQKVSIPIMPASVSNAHGMTVKGDSMDRFYPDGTTIICAEIADYNDLKDGQHVICEVWNEKGRVEKTIKEVKKEEDGMLLWARSTNPKWQQPVFVSEDTPDHIKITAVVLGSFRWNV